MGRLFTQHIRRNVQSLDGAWRFCTDPEDLGAAEQWFCGLPAATQTIVPSVFNTQLGLLEYEGAAWYEKTFYTREGCLQLCFEGVMTQADVWLDGNKLGSHYGGFCQFEFLVPWVDAGPHRLTVRVDNRFDQNSIPQVKTDWYHYGGITRSVTAQQPEGLCTLYQRLEYTLSEDLKTLQGRFCLELYNASGEETTDTVFAYLDDTAVYAEAITLPAGAHKTLFTPEFTLTDVRLWNVGAPQLYQIRIATATDDLLDRTGFRRVETKDQKIYLNGKPLEILGINRHEEHPDWGMAFPAGLMQRDLDILEDLGCNSLRGAHYPNSRIFVDMLDERGITFWSEIPMWGKGFGDDQLTDPVIQRGLAMHRQMVRYYYNHPSILIWGMHNEIKTQAEPAPAVTELYYRFLKEHGGNRLVTYATDRPLDDLCLAFCDIICLNRYIGWYGPQHRSQWQEDVDAFRQRWQALSLTDKPVLYSEFGGAAIYGHHTFDDLRGTEEYQAQLLKICLETFHRDPMVAGTYIWQFCDIRTCRQMGLDRARSYNNKGILNEYRKPKLAYYTVRELYHQFRQEANGEATQR